MDSSLSDRFKYGRYAVVGESYYVVSWLETSDFTARHYRPRRLKRVSFENILFVRVVLDKSRSFAAGFKPNPCNVLYHVSGRVLGFRACAASSVLVVRPKRSDRRRIRS